MTIVLTYARQKDRRHMLLFIAMSILIYFLWLQAHINPRSNSVKSSPIFQNSFYLFYHFLKNQMYLPETKSAGSGCDQTKWEGFLCHRHQIGYPLFFGFFVLCKNKPSSPKRLELVIWFTHNRKEHCDKEIRDFHLQIYCGIWLEFMNIVCKWISTRKKES